MRFWLGQFFSDRKAHRLAFTEVVIVCALSLVPLFLLAVRDQIPLENSSIGRLFSDALGSGQLYLYSFSLFGTLFYLCQKEHENFARFEPRIILMFLTVIPCLLIIGIYATNPTMERPLSQGLVKISYAVYGLYVVLYYILLVFDHLTPPPVEKGLQQASSSLMEDFQKTAGGSNG